MKPESPSATLSSASVERHESPETSLNPGRPLVRESAGIAFPASRIGELRANSLRRDFGNKTVLEEVSFHVRSGRICALLGRNGSGKTTLLKLLAGLIEPTAGESLLGDHRSWPCPPRLLQQCGSVLDGFEPPGGMKLKHLKQLSAAAGPAFDESRADQLLASHQLSLSRTWGTLSKGQKRWVLLVMQICRNCEVLLLDEPADGLDPQTRIELYQLLRREANQRELTALVATHIISDIERVADDVCILHQGRILLHADIEELRDQLWMIDIAPASTDQQLTLPDGVELLHQQQAAGTRIWIRDLRSSPEEWELAGEIRRRRPPLEELYLAVTDTTPQTTGDHRC
ncbi:MAG: ABC transporter ATP-binding protein [Planctomycetaceae bacterium]|nr:ABC transporter ATP-binding protein [Planctomycetaceae bacterium]